MRPPIRALLVPALLVTGCAGARARPTEGPPQGLPFVALPQGRSPLAVGTAGDLNQRPAFVPGAGPAAGPGYASASAACADACGAAAERGGEVALNESGSAAPIPPQGSPSPEERHLHLGPLAADRTAVPLGRVSQQLDLKLRSLARTGLLQAMPDSFLLTLHVDASGAVIRVAYDRPCGRAGELVELQLLGWRFDTWMVPGTTELRLSVQVLP